MHCIDECVQVWYAARVNKSKVTISMYLLDGLENYSSCINGFTIIHGISFITNPCEVVQNFPQSILSIIFASHILGIFILLSSVFMSLKILYFSFGDVSCSISHRCTNRRIQVSALCLCAMFLRLMACTDH